jgi:hypothetical protein
MQRTGDFLCSWWAGGGGALIISPALITDEISGTQLFLSLIISFTLRLLYQLALRAAFTQGNKIKKQSTSSSFCL